MTWLIVLVEVSAVVGAFVAGLRIGLRHARVPPLPPRLADPPEPEADARDDWWRE